MAEYTPLRGTLRLSLTDSAGNDLNTTVRLRLATGLAGGILYDGPARVERDLEIQLLPFGSILIRVEPEGYEERFANVTIDALATELSMRFNVDTSMVTGIEAPEFDELDPRLQNILNKSSVKLPTAKIAYKGAKLYKAMDPYCKATLFNTFTKTNTTILTNGVTVWDKVQRLRSVDKDSLVLNCRRELFDYGQEATVEAGNWAPGWKRGAQVSIFQTDDSAGALDITMFRAPKSSVVANVTIGAGAAGGGSPFNVRDILVGEQGLTLDYRPVIKKPVFGAGVSVTRAITIEPSLPRSARIESGIIGGGVTFDTRDFDPGFSSRSLDLERGEDGGAYEDADEQRYEGSSKGGDLMSAGGEFESVDESLSEAAWESPKIDEDKPAPALFVNQGLTDALGEKLTMDSPLRPGQSYLYWFEIARTPRKINDHDVPEVFEEPDALKRAPVTVQVQVTCPLIADGYAARNVVYEPGIGLDTQSFPLFSLPGIHPFVVQVIYDAKPVYSKKWEITVTEFAAGVGRGAPPIGEKSSTASVPRSGSGTVAHRLVADGSYVKRLALEIPGHQPFKGAPAPEAAALIERAAAARAMLNKFARTTSPNVELKIDWPAAWVFLREMTIWGSETAELIFGKRVQQEEFYRAMESVPRGSYLHIDSDPGSFPWEWLYLGKVPPADAPALGSPALDAALDGFLGYHFLCDLLPSADLDRLGVREVLPNQAKTCVLSAVNTTADTDAAPRNHEFVQTLKDWKMVESSVYISREATVEALKAFTTPPGKPLHLLYVYCHHQPGAQLNDKGFNNFGDSTLYMKGKDEDPITRTYMQYNSEIGAFTGCAPLVLLNACGTALGNDYYPSGFMPYFTNTLNVPAVIGTVAEVPTLAAYQFAREFLPGWLATGSALDTIAAIRRRWMRERGNPYAMYYAVYGNGQVRLQQLHQRSDA